MGPLVKRVSFAVIVLVIIFLAVLAGRLIEVVNRERIVAGEPPHDGEPVFRIDPFFEQLSQLAIYHENLPLVVQLSRGKGSNQFVAVYYFGKSELKNCVVPENKVAAVAHLLNPPIEHFIGFKIDDNGHGIPQEELPLYGFGVTEISTAPGYILYKSFGMEEQLIGLGNLAGGEPEVFYASQGGGISTVNLRPVFEAVQGLCSENSGG